MGYDVKYLLDVLGSCRRQIIRSGKKYPNVVIDDLFSCINHVLNNYDYDGKYAENNGKSYK